MKLNSDLGEGYTDVDVAVMPLIDQANIACGGHAGDANSMRQAIELALTHNVEIGAHPSYPDKENFGRKSRAYSIGFLQHDLITQIDTLRLQCQAVNATLSYIKPHGALYHDLLSNSAILFMLLEIIRTHFPSLYLMMQSTPHNDHFKEVGKSYGVNVVFEAFADRAYTNEGLLQPREEAGAVLDTATKIEAQAKSIIHHSSVITTQNMPLHVNASSLCVHGDTPSARDAIARIRECIHHSFANHD